jgi:hypothetical protein
LATNSINSLFRNPNDPKRLASPLGGASISDAINTAQNNLANLDQAGNNADAVANLTQLLNFAKGLQMLIPYFTDLSMNAVSISNQTAGSFQSINSSISSLGISNSAYQQELAGLVASVANALNSIVLLSEFKFN